MLWTKQVFKFRTSSEKTGKKYKGTFRVMFMATTGTAWFDNIQLYEIKE
ncbi:MAG: hypothetical protein GY750_12710 [Lentisphaerae bacterium]|nr:hypothetical protein [Lentisphaerota bacterium]MCP4102274.1 hypothetical protein [Lentisphaerota bacterium]